MRKFSSHFHPIFILILYIKKKIGIKNYISNIKQFLLTTNEWDNLGDIQKIVSIKDIQLVEKIEKIVSDLTDRIHEEYMDNWIKVNEYNKKLVRQLQDEYQELEREKEKIVSDLTARIYELERENEQLKQSEPTPEPKSETPAKKPTLKPKFKLPENFADYQQECDDLINALSCFYDIKKGKWNGNILQFILTPSESEKAKHPYPAKWKAGLYLQPGQWTVDKVIMSDPDDWQDWFMDINDFADANDIKIS